MKNPIFKLVWLSLILAFTLMLITPFSSVVTASNTSQTSYRATIRVVNAGTATAYNVSVPISINTTNLINGSYMAANLSNTSMQDNYGNDSGYSPIVNANTTWMFFVPSIQSLSSIDYGLYMGGTLDADGKLALFPGTAGIDTGAFSFGSGQNMTFNISGYFNLDGLNAASYIWLKTLSIRLNNPVAGNLSLGINGTTKLDVSGVSSGEHNIAIKIFRQGDVDSDGDVDTADKTLVQNMILGLATVTDRGDVNGNGSVSIGDVTVVENLIASGDNITTGRIYVDGVISGHFEEEDLVMVYSPGYNLLSAYNPVVPYWLSQNVTVDNAIVQQAQWQNSTPFTDTSGHGNNATPTFRTTTTNANVTASLVDFQTDHEAILTSWSLSGYDSFVKDIPSQPGGMYEGVSPTFPGHSIPDEISTAGGVPTSLFWFIFPCLIIVVIGLVVHDKSKSLVAQSGIIGLCILFVSLAHIWSFWILIPFALMAGAACLAGKVYSY